MCSSQTNREAKEVEHMHPSKEKQKWQEVPEEKYQLRGPTELQDWKSQRGRPGETEKDILKQKTQDAVGVQKIFIAWLLPSLHFEILLTHTTQSSPTSEPVLWSHVFIWVWIKEKNV